MAGVEARGSQMAQADGEEGEQNGGAQARSSWGRLVPVAALILGAIALLLLLPFGSAILSDVHKRNQRDLGIAASGLENWSDAIQAVALGNFIRGRVGGLSADERDARDGWKLRATLRHPSLREYRVVYATGAAADCDTIEAKVRATAGGLPFVSGGLAASGGMLKLIGKFSVAEIYARDQRAGVQDATVAAYLRDIDTTAAPPPGVSAKDLMVCYGAVIPVEGLLQVRSGNQGFTTLLVASPEGQILTQVGAERLPLSSIDALKPEASGTTGDVISSAGRVLAKAGGVQSEDLDALGPARPPPARLIETLDPVELSVGGRSYYAYARPFFPPAESFADCRPAELQKEPVAAGERGHCYVVGLMPKAEVWRQLANPPLLLTICLALAIGIVLVLLPAARLILLGPGEAIGRLEMAMLALGIPAAASLATLLILVLTDVSAHRAAAETRATDIATTAAARASAEISARVEAATSRATLLASFEKGAMGGPVMVAAEKQLIADMEASAGKAPFLALTGAPDALPPELAQRCLHDALATEWASPPGKWTKTNLPPAFTETGMPLVADPRPLRCIEAPLCRAGADADTGLPLLELGGLVDLPGRRLAGLRAIACRAFPGGRTELAGRDYFRRLVTGHPGLLDGKSTAGLPYTVAQVMALQDSIPQTVIAVKIAAPAWHIAPGYAAPDAFLVSTTSLPSLVRPVLPPPYQLMVVDTRDPSLPVIMQREPGRAGAERLDEMVRDPDEVRGLLRGAVATPGTAARFERYYDGADRRFSAVGIKGTRWAVVVHHDKDETDTMPVQTAWRALLTWETISILFGGAWLLWLMLVGQNGVHSSRLGMQILSLGGRGWPRLWPQEGHSAVYESLFKGLVLLAAVAFVATIALAASGAAAAGIVLLALAVRAAAALWLHLALKTAPETVAVLRPETQIRYARLSVALILCLSTIPMLAFWWDARELMAGQQKAAIVATVAGPDGRLAESRRALADLRWVLGITSVSQTTGVSQSTGASPPFGIAFDSAANTEPTPSSEGFAGFLQRIQRGMPQPNAGASRCSTPATDIPKLCGPDLAAISWEPPAIWRTAIDPPLLLLLMGVAAGLAFMLWSILKRTLAALCGFGIALEAVTYPNLFLGNLWDKPAPAVPAQTLNRKSLLVNAPWTIMPMLDRMGGPAGDKANRRIIPFDLSGLDSAASTLPVPTIARGDIIELYGLELVLADSARRLMALRAVENLVAQVDKLETEDDLTDPFLLFFAPTAPMDRILDAYERERDSALIDGTRENLRWARLFEDFATFHFRPIQSTEGHAPETSIAKHQPAWEALDSWEKEAIQTVYSELRWLSPRVINGCINEEVTPAATLLDTGILPLGALVAPPRSPYPDLYSDRLMQWALLRNFAGPAATLAYLRAQFIEHYQRQWSGSTRAERLVLHHLAAGRFVNMASGLAFASLLRRGVIILDPEPRLMNESFAMFVRQAEKLDRIAEWQKDMPAGAWVRAQLPILLAIGAAGLLLVGLVVAGGQQPAKLLPVLAAGLPALLAALHRMVRSS